MIAGWGERERSLLHDNAVWLIAFLAFAASITGIRNGFAFDDVRVIVEDQRLHQLQNAWHAFGQTYWLPKYGGSLFRPLTSFGFSLQWAMGHGSPFPFHVVSIALYVATSAAVFRLASQLFDEKAALIGAAIFAVHPLHVEAVANIVGQAELGAALFVVVGVSLYVDWWRARKVGPLQVAVLCLLYLCALMFKEHAVVMPALIVAVELLPSSIEEDGRQRLKRLWPVLLSMGIVGLSFVAIRAHIIGQVSGGGDEASVFVGQGFDARFLTMLRVVLEWIRLFLWPATLSADYSPPRISTATEFNPVMVPAVVVIAGLIAIAVWLRQRTPAATFSFSWAAITLLIPSNLIIVTGFVLAERAMFLPSIGVSLLLGAGVALILRVASQSARQLTVATLVVVIAAGVVRSSYRNPVWKNNEALFRQTVDDVPASWKAHIMLGEVLVNQGKGEGVFEMKLAYRLSPKNDVYPRYLIAHRLGLAKRREAALPFFREAIALAPANAGIRAEAAYCLAKTGRMDEALAIANDGLKLSPADARLLGFLAFADGSGPEDPGGLVLSPR